jgi:hypothetical protein
VRRVPTGSSGGEILDHTMAEIRGELERVRMAGAGKSVVTSCTLSVACGSAGIDSARSRR